MKITNDIILAENLIGFFLPFERGFTPVNITSIAQKDTKEHIGEYCLYIACTLPLSVRFL
ncbi:MAG: hypothetical protein ACM3P1_05255 [Candidatus Saccharibacteria bacterium]